MKFRIECQNCLQVWFTLEPTDVRRWLMRHLEDEGHKDYHIKVE